MTNAEKYLKEGVNARKFSEKLADYILKDIYTYEGTEKEIDELIEEFLNINGRPTLTEDERVILKNLIGCEWKIGREKSGELYLITVAHTKRYFGMYLHLFQFIKEGEEYSIEELLNG